MTLRESEDGLLHVRKEAKDSLFKNCSDVKVGQRRAKEILFVCEAEAILEVMPHVDGVMAKVFTKIYIISVDTTFVLMEAFRETSLVGTFGVLEEAA